MQKLDGTTEKFTPYAQHVGDLPANQDLELILCLAHQTLVKLRGVSDCHTAAQNFVAAYKIGKAVRGYFYPNFEHSWIEFETYLLDIYPVGGCRPHLVAKK
jgi:hypothetical protein